MSVGVELAIPPSHIPLTVAIPEIVKLVPPAPKPVT